ncbi:MAG: alcohol dehydrogenase catalytic domain-containing protein [Betaproteobacteria bacterium]|nr:alcohol dehydrogenase catalytic domain-containing protein [Betaproteobacteria bacterium]
MISYDVVEHGKPLQRVLKETPRPKGTEVLVRITRSGVCHSDLHIWDGYFDLGGGRKFYVKDRGCIPPFTMGHEPFGIVEAIGPRVEGVKVGARRVVFPWIGCGKCAVCKAGQDNYCLSQKFLGVYMRGAFGTHLLIPHPKYLVDSSGVDDAFAATLACSGLTAYSAINKLPELGPKDWVAVLGCGGLGLVAVSIMKAKGIRNVIACDVDDVKLAAAKKLGARLALDTRAPDAAQCLGQLAGGNLAGAIDFVGMPATLNLAYPVLRKGGRYILCGLFGGEVTLPLPPIAQRAVGIIGSYVGNLQELKQVVALAKKKSLRPTPMETRPASELNCSLEELKAGKILGRVVLDLETEAA